MNHYYIMTHWGMDEVDAEDVELYDGHLIFRTDAKIVGAFAPGEWRGFVIAK